MLGTMRSLFILALFSLVDWSNSQTCPAKYARLTPNHSFCVRPNPACQITRTGVSQQDKDLIVKLHNEFRSKVAMGNEGRSIGGGLPKAADMMQMVWDDELAAVAQKWSESCVFDHDCNECRSVENFGVGQNLFFSGSYSENPDWTQALTGFYDEVVHYNKNWLDSYVSRPGPKTGHLTQMIWSESWRVGCGFAYYKKGGKARQYYACNYGPRGNFRGDPVYKKGEPCTACPTNTQCSTSSRGANTFPGLCKMDDPNTAPTYKIDPKGLFFYCGASSSDKDCRHDFSGAGSLKTVNSVGGKFYSVVLNGGQSATLAFKSPLAPPSNVFCLRINFRKGPLDDSRQDKSIFQLEFKMGGGYVKKIGPLNTGKSVFMDLPYTLSWTMKSDFSIVFSVPRGAGQHSLDIRSIMAYDGRCPESIQ